MTRTLVSRLLLVALVLGVIGLLLPAPADACSGKCVRVPGTFCRYCADAGFETGVLCQDSGGCGCFYIQCASSTPNLPEGDDTPIFSSLEAAEQCQGAAEPAVEEAFLTTLASAPASN
ncbi:MAG TPA: hypothetical protein VF017_00775 [Thermoanaerobaculia bacterium]|nr:hypothetical protein [Thermoanaerobaculia bacterium]